MWSVSNAEVAVVKFLDCDIHYPRKDEKAGVHSLMMKEVHMMMMKVVQNNVF